MKIRLKITILFAIIVAALLLIFSFSIFYFYALFREIEFFERLKDKAIKTVELLNEVETIDEEILQIVDRHDLTTLYGEEIMIYDINYNLIYKSGKDYIKVPKAMLPDIKKRKEIRLYDDQRETIGIWIKDYGNEFLVIASAFDKYGYKKLENLILILSSGWFFSVIIVFFVGYYFSDNVLKPISNVVNQVEKITASNLNMRLKIGNGNDELAQLAITFNRMLARLEESFVMQKNFVANASHELRTPMTVITGQIEVTLMQQRQPEEYRQTMISILEDVRNLTKMSNGLLELARLGADEMYFKLKPVRIDELIWQARSELSRKNTNNKIKVNFENFPEEEDKLMVRGDENLLKTAFINLMENGCKFSKNATVEVLVIIFFNKIQVLFMDNGPGIPKEDLLSIFQPFYRSISTRHIGGYGIGLSLVDKIIAIHKGFIEVTSTANVGTIFTVTLFH